MQLLRTPEVSRAFTLTETVVALAITGMMVGGIVTGFLQSAKQAEWSAYSYAAQSQALRGLEQLAPTNYTVVDILDIPTAGNNVTYCTNVTTIRTISAVPPLREITVETSWRYFNRGIFTNVVRTYRTADQ
jgi:type II secretory pathway pseudopilin PulG